jgi:hypothetical protein
MIWVIDHDSDGDSSMVFTDSDIGDYHRLIEPGTYDIIASSEGYISDTAKNIVVPLENVVWVNFELKDDSILLKTDPGYINDTLFFDQINTHNIIISNDNHALSTTYDITIENEAENYWIELNKISGTLSGTQNDTVIVSINSELLSAGRFSTNILLTAADNQIDTIPIQIFVNNIQSNKNKANISEFKLYPNPFNNHINIEFFPIGYQKIKLNIFNIFGNYVFTKEINIFNHIVNKLVINDYFDVNQLPNGIYFIQLSTSDFQITKKVIKH